MSRKLGVVSGATASLQSLAASIVSKATNNSVALAAADAATPAALALGSSPKDAHTVTINAAPAAGIYAGSNFTFVRSVLPRGADDSLQLRDALDAFPASGINNAAEVAQAKASIAETAKVAVSTAKASGAKLTVVVKQQSKFEQVNQIFADAIDEAAQGSGVEVEILDSATATNQIVMFPERARVVTTADTPAADNLELAISGLFGAARTYHRAAGKVSAGSSPATVALAVADALKELGMTSEAKKVADAASKASNDGGKSIVASL